MKENRHSSKTKQIRSLLLILSCGVASAFIIALGLLYYYNPSGIYLAKNVLIAPENALNMAFNHADTKKDGRRLVFDAIEFSYFDPDLRQSRHHAIDMKKYEEFYALISDDKSLVDTTDEVKRFFIKGHPANLKLKVRTDREASKAVTPDVFLEVTFADNGDFYRIQLREQGKGEGWAYFYHPDIHRKVLNLFK
jgi:hypothetical protein